MHVSALERADLRAEIGRERHEAARVDEFIALGREHRREAEFGITPGVAVAVVGEKAADVFVRRHRRPHRGVDGDDVFETPKEVIRPIETLGRITFAREEPRLPRRDSRDARHAVELALIRHRIRRFRRRRHEHQVDFVFQDQVRGDFTGAIRAGLTVLDDDLHRMCLAADGQTAVEVLLHRGDDERIGFAEGG